MVKKLDKKMENFGGQRTECHYNNVIYQIYLKITTSKNKQ